MKDSRLHIAYLVSTLGRSGPTRQLFYLIRNLDSRRFRATIITLSPEPRDSLRTEFSRLEVDLECLTATRTNNPFFIYKRLNGLLSSIQPDILHSQGFRADVFGLLLSSALLQISSQRNDPFEEYPPLYGAILGRVIAFTHAWCLRHITRVVTCSHSLTQKNTKYGVRSDFVRNGISQSLAITPDATSLPKEALTFFHLFDRHPVFLYSGPLVSRKQPQMLLRAFLEPGLQHLGLVVLGDGPLLSECRAITNDAPNILFAGAVDNVDQYLHKSACYVSASLSEGLPNSVLEAFRAGLPAILSDIPAHRELKGLAPRAVHIFRADNASDFCSAISSFTRLSNIGEVTARAIQDHFDSDKMSVHYQEIYVQMMGRGIEFKMGQERG